jgi:hypothetical protein
MRGNWSRLLLLLTVVLLSGIVPHSDFGSHADEHDSGDCSACILLSSFVLISVVSVLGEYRRRTENVFIASEMLRDGVACSPRVTRGPPAFNQ